MLLVDTEGTPLGLRVVPADTHEQRALRALVPSFAVQPTLLLIWQGRRFASLHFSHGGVDDESLAEVVKPAALHGLGDSS